MSTEYTPTPDMREGLSEAIHQGWVDEDYTPPGHEVEKVWNDDTAINAVLAHLTTAGWGPLTAAATATAERSELSAAVGMFVGPKEVMHEPLVDYLWRLGYARMTTPAPTNTPQEFSAAVGEERLRHPDKGYDDAHDAKVRAEIVAMLSGPFDGTEGLDSITLAWAIGRIEGRRA